MTSGMTGKNVTAQLVRGLSTVVEPHHHYYHSCYFSRLVLLPVVEEGVI